MRVLLVCAKSACESTQVHDFENPPNLLAPLCLGVSPFYPVNVLGEKRDMSLRNSGEIKFSRETY